MKIYTKPGDKGETSLIGGKRVPKYHIRIESYGTVDELISHIGLLRDQEIEKGEKSSLLKIQEHLMVISAILASDCDNCGFKLPKFNFDAVNFLEKEIDAMQAILQPLSSFLIPGGHPTVSICHVARTVCRRTERIIHKLAEESFVPEPLLIYLNRLSDYLFVLSRKLASDFQVVEYRWEPDL